MQARPITPQALVAELADRIAATRPGRWLRVAVDGPEPAAAPGPPAAAPDPPPAAAPDPPAAGPDALAAALVDPLRVRGRAVLPIRAADFLRPASVRLESGRQDPDGYYDRWLDESGLRREVLDRLGPGGSGRVLPSLWDPVADRATRAGYRTVPPGGVVLVSGVLLLGRALPFDLTIHLALSPGALARRTDPELAWTLPAFARYRREVDPVGTADLVIRADDPEHPALVDPGDSVDATPW